MKTYLLNAVQRLKNYSQKLDANAVLYDKSWEVFNETGDKELMIFRANKELLISRNGIVQKGTWELLDIANLIIDVGEKTFLFNTAYVEDKFLALKLDGTKEYMVMIETDMKDRFSLDSVKSIEGYLDDRYKMIEQERIDKEEEEKKRIEETKQRRLEHEEQIRINKKLEEKREKAELEREKLQEIERIKDQEKREKLEQERKENLEIIRIADIKKNAKKRYHKTLLVQTILGILTITSYTLVAIYHSFEFNYGLNVDSVLVIGGTVFLLSLVYNSDRYIEHKKDYQEYKEIIKKQ